MVRSCARSRQILSVLCTDQHPGLAKNKKTATRLGALNLWPRAEDNIFLFGRSLGGAVAIWLAAESPTKVRDSRSQRRSNRAIRAPSVVVHAIVCVCGGGCCARVAGARRSRVCVRSRDTCRVQVKGLIVENTFCGIREMARLDSQRP